MLLSGALWREVFSNKSLRCLLYSVDKGIKSGQKGWGEEADAQHLGVSH